MRQAGAAARRGRSAGRSPRRSPRRAAPCAGRASAARGRHAAAGRRFRSVQPRRLPSLVPTTDMEGRVATVKSRRPAGRGSKQRALERGASLWKKGPKGRAPREPRLVALKKRPWQGWRGEVLFAGEWFAVGRFRQLLDSWNTRSLTTQFLLAGGLASLLAMVVVGILVSNLIASSVTQNSAAATALYVDSVIAPLLPDMRTSRRARTTRSRMRWTRRSARARSARRLVSFRLWRQATARSSTPRTRAWSASASSRATT